MLSPLRGLTLTAARSLRLASTNATSLPTKAAAATKTTITEPSFIKITLARSLIGLNRKLYRVAYGLGLTKRGRTVFQRVTPGVAGSVLRLKEVVQIEHATPEDVTAYEKAHKPRRPKTPASPGFKVVGNILEIQKEKTL